MSEIERAIEQIKDHIRVHRIGQYPHVYLADALNMAIDALKEKLDREKNPLTCEGCRSYELRYTMAQPCVDCFRSKSDRYEPKGEKA